MALETLMLLSDLSVTLNERSLHLSRTHLTVTTRFFQSHSCGETTAAAAAAAALTNNAQYRSTS